MELEAGKRNRIAWENDRCLGRVLLVYLSFGKKLGPTRICPGGSAGPTIRKKKKTKQQ